MKKVKTDDAEIKLIMLLQRAHGAESWVKNRLANGPLRVQSNEFDKQVLCYVYAAGLAQSILQR